MGCHFTKKVMRMIVTLALATSCSVKASSVKGAMDYNGNLITRGGGITISPRTSSAILAGYTQSINTDGLLDNTFGSLGTVISIIGTATEIHAVALQPDGKIVVGGFATIGTPKFTVARFNTNGSLDTSFGNGAGYVTTVMGTDDRVNGIVIQSDGKIVAGGYARPGGGVYQFVVVRYNANGTLDTTFNAAGATPGIQLTTLVGGTNATGTGIALQPDGKIVVGGSTGDGGGNTVYGVVRYNANGTLDTQTFGAGTGIALAPNFGSAGNSCTGIVLQADGKIVLGGDNLNGVYRFATARFTTDGTLDTATFGNGLGYVLTAVGVGGTRGLAVTLQSDQKIVVCGFTDPGTTCIVARYTTAGVLDTATFGNGLGYVLTPIVVNGVTGTAGQLDSLVMQPDGKIIAAGEITFGGVKQFALLRYNSNGTLDTTFGSAGIMLVSVAAANSIVYAIAQQVDGKLVGVGKSGTNFAILRYINPFTLASFTASYGNVGLL